MSPGGPVVTGFTDTEVLIFNSVLVEGVPETLDAHIEHALLFRTALPDEQIVHFVIGLRVIEEFSKGLLRIVVTCAEDTEVCKEVKGFQTYEDRVTAPHRETGNGPAMRICDSLVVAVDEGDDDLPILTRHDVESEVGVPGMIAVNDLIVHKRDQHGLGFSFCEEIVHDEVHASVIHPV